MTTESWSLTMRLNRFFRAIQRGGSRDPSDVEEGRTEFSAPELLRFLDTIKPHPKWWEQHLRAENVLGDDDWISLQIEFKMGAGESLAKAAPSILSMVRVDMIKNGRGAATEEIERIAPVTTRVAADETRTCWLLRADLMSVQCDDESCTAPIYVALEDHHVKCVVARHFTNGRDDDRDPYYVPITDMMEPQPGWEYSRYSLAGLFAGDHDRNYFKGLIVEEAIKDDARWFKVRWTLPFATTFLLCADESDEWACDAVRRHDGEAVWVPARWYDDFSERMTGWLKLRQPSEIPFQLHVAEAAPRERTYLAQVVAKCVFVGNREPVINIGVE
jgi:hypothetical protein